MAIRHLDNLKGNDYFGDKGGTPCVVREMRTAPSNEYIALHDHSFSELVIVAAGSLKHIHTKGIERISAGDFFVIHPGERHGYAELAQGTSVFNLIYRGELPPALLFGDCPLAPLFFPGADDKVYANRLGRVPRRALPDILALVRELRREERANRPLRFAVCASLFSTIILLLSRFMQEGQPSPTNALLAETKFIEDNLAAKITLRDLRAVAGRSTRAIYAEFSKVFGKTPGDYILGLRVARAKSLLGVPGRTLKDVAEQTGFCSASHLSRTLSNKIKS